MKNNKASLVHETNKDDAKFNTWKRTLFTLIKRTGFAVLFWGVGVVWGQWSDPVLMDTRHDTLGINTGAQEWCPFVSADGNYFYFTREHTNNDLYVCHREGDGWSHPLRLPFCQELVDERNPSTNATNDTLYFISWAPGWDTFWSFRTGPEDTAWSQPEQMPEPINSNGIEFAVWATPDNQRLLFSSWRIGANGEDIYECRRDASTPTGWSDPILLPGQINTGNAAYIESYPSMGADTTEIFFWGRYTRLYHSVLADSGWARGDSLPDTINRVIPQSPHQSVSEITPCITPDGHRLYFSSHWNGDSVATAGDIWYSERPQEVPGRANRPRDSRLGLNIKVVPNPANNTFSVKIPGATQRIAIYDILGRMLTEEELQLSTVDMTWKPKLNMMSLATGVYLVNANSANGTQTVPVYIIK